jgi:hypothetical protein
VGERERVERGPRRRIAVQQRPQSATASRTALHACLDDWAARPERLTEELLDVYDTATTAPLWPAERPPQAAMVETVRQIRGVGRYRPLRDGRRVLRAQLAYLDDLYAQPIDACAEVKAWRATGWGAQRPPQIARIHRVVVAARREFRAHERTIYQTSQFLKRHGGKLGREIDESVWLGLERPDNRDNCDDVLVAVAPEEAFCG